MSTFEIILIVCACSIPVIAILFVVKPRFKRRHLIPPATMPYVSDEKQKAKTQEKETSKANEFSQSFMNRGEATDEFKDYLNYKKSTISSPSKMDVKDLPDTTTPYIRNRRIDRTKENKTISEQVDDLSPEMFALIFSGAFDRKYFN